MIIVGLGEASGKKVLVGSGGWGVAVAGDRREGVGSTVGGAVGAGSRERQSVMAMMASAARANSGQTGLLSGSRPGNCRPGTLRLGL